MRRIIYARGFPYGAPLVMLRGGATRDDDVRDLLRARGYRWEMSGRGSHAWETYEDRSDLAETLTQLRELGCEVLAKKTMDPGYLIEGFAERQR